MTDKALYKRIESMVKNGSWKDIKELGINAQMALRIRNGERVKFRDKTLARLREKFAPKAVSVDSGSVAG